MEAAGRTPAGQRYPATIEVSIAFAIALVPYILLVWKFNWLNDDAFISFRYAANFAGGHGLVFNPGSNPPTEGYSNFLWVVYLAVFERLGLDITFWSRITSISCGAALLGWLTVFIQRRFSFAWPTLATLAVIFATLPSIAIWSTSGLAMMPTALFVFATFERLLGDPKHPKPVQAGLFGALAALTRADGVGFVGLVLAAALLLWVDRREARVLRATVLVALIVGAAVAAHIAFRYSYYEALVPNTARVKAGFAPQRLGRGFDYIVTALLTTPAVVVCVLAGLAALRTGAGILAVQLLGILAGGAAYSLYVGGDFMPMGRLLVPVLAFAPILLALGFERFVPLVSMRVMFGLALVALSLPPAWNMHLLPRDFLARFQFRRAEALFASEYENWHQARGLARGWSVLGKALKRYTQPGESIVLYQVGAAGYYGDHLTVYDMYALTDREAVRHGRIAAAGSPGHDLVLAWSHYLDRNPTYMAAMVTPLGRVVDLSPLQPAHPWITRVNLETHPLQRVDGFPPNLQLILGRLGP